MHTEVRPFDVEADQGPAAEASPVAPPLEAKSNTHEHDAARARHASAAQRRQNTQFGLGVLTALAFLLGIFWPTLWWVAAALAVLFVAYVVLANEASRRDEERLRMLKMERIVAYRQRALPPAQVDAAPERSNPEPSNGADPLYPTADIRHVNVAATGTDLEAVPEMPVVADPGLRWADDHIDDLHEPTLIEVLGTVEDDETVCADLTAPSSVADEGGAELDDAEAEVAWSPADDAAVGDAVVDVATVDVDEERSDLEDTITGLDPVPDVPLPIPPGADAPPPPSRSSKTAASDSSVSAESTSVESPSVESPPVDSVSVESGVPFDEWIAEMSADAEGGQIAGRSVTGSPAKSVDEPPSQSADKPADDDSSRNGSERASEELAATDTTADESAELDIETEADPDTLDQIPLLSGWGETARPARTWPGADGHRRRPWRDRRRRRTEAEVQPVPDPFRHTR